ncbi:hypothetical protein [Arabidopsis thaliana]|uniref:Uncharacterized protein AT4g02920 n=1 Tax=Arabidopsis thaliana TaxID=3702 RepID=Q9ZT90_ARATH|nr:hypothetical protein [Arabidopsis thaliana]AAD15338.1 hypothetical protein [Arabidopsis thaliana]CAB77777.1 hypothetical protein [Arabidopsis thaliana]
MFKEEEISYNNQKMIKLCFMTSHGYSIPGLGLPQDLCNTEIIKNSRSHLVNPGARQEIIPASSFNLNTELLEPWKPVSSFSQFVEIDSAMMKPLLMDVHETAPESLILSFGIADKFARQEKVMEFLLSQSEEFKEKGFDMSLLNELMEFESMKSSSQLRPYDTSSVLYLNQELGKPVLDLVRDMMENPEFSVRSNVQFVKEFNNKMETALTAYPTLSECSHIRILFFIRTSPEKSRLKSPRKHNTKRKAKERDLYKRNHLHAYESLLSLMIGNDHRHKHTTVLSLQKSCGELSELLTQFSITAAGTGIAVLFSVVCSLASRRVPFCANKFFDTGLGLSLVILSWAVNRLREVIVHVNRKANKPCSSLKDDEIINSVERSMKEVYYRAATVIAVFALRFAC